MSKLLQAGQSYTLVDRVNGGELDVRCISVSQRNWSRIAEATVSKDSRSGKSENVFLKQYVDRRRVWNTQLWASEGHATRQAIQFLNGDVHVPVDRIANESLLIHAYEFVEMESLDVLLRKNSMRFSTTFPSVLRKMRNVLETMEQGVPALLKIDTLSVKQRDYGGPSQAINFKGFDIRNVSIIGSDEIDSDSCQVGMFDFGKVYLAPIEEAAAKLFISIGLLNWGKPLRRFAIGPDFELLTQSIDPLQPYLNRHALAAKIQLQEKIRSSVTQGRNALERLLKRTGIRVLGGPFLRRLASWCERHVS